MEIVIIVIVAVIVLGVLAARLGVGGSMRDDTSWPDRSHQTPGSTGAGDGGAGVGDAGGN